jgi:hypothetical protein
MRYKTGYIVLVGCRNSCFWVFGMGDEEVSCSIDTCELKVRGASRRSSFPKDIYTMTFWDTDYL